MLADKLLQAFTGERKLYYGAYKGASEHTMQIVSGPEHENMCQEQDRRHSEIETLQRDLADLDLSMERTEEEVEELDALTEKWTAAAVEAFQELQRSLTVSIRLEELVHAAGFRPDDFDFDYDELNISEDQLREEIPNPDNMMMYD